MVIFIMKRLLTFTLPETLPPEKRKKLEWGKVCILHFN